MKKIIIRAFSKVVTAIGKVEWMSKSRISASDTDKIRDLLTSNYFIILTRRRNHLSTYFTNLADFVLSGRWGYWSHALMNLEDEVKRDSDFKIVPLSKTALIEATSAGVHKTPFEQVFDVHSAVLMKPKLMPLDHWTLILDRGKEQLGKPYDTLFNIADANSLSCVELVRYILQGEPNYEINFANFEALIKKSKNLSPQMIFDCGDFEVVFETRVR